MKNKKLRMGILIICLITTLACGAGYSTTHIVRGDQGQVVVKTNSADGSDETSIEIDEEYSWETIQMTITVSVESGSYRATITDSKGTTVTLDASAGNPSSASALMETDGFGQLSLQSEASSAEGVEITIDYTVPY